MIFGPRSFHCTELGEFTVKGARRKEARKDCKLTPSSQSYLRPTTCAPTPFLRQQSHVLDRLSRENARTICYNPGWRLAFWQVSHVPVTLLRCNELIFGDALIATCASASLASCCAFKLVFVPKERLFPGYQLSVASKVALRISGREAAPDVCQKKKRCAWECSNRPFAFQTSSVVIKERRRDGTRRTGFARPFTPRGMCRGTEANDNATSHRRRNFL